MIKLILRSIHRLLSLAFIGLACTSGATTLLERRNPESPTELPVVTYGGELDFAGRHLRLVAGRDLVGHLSANPGMALAVFTSQFELPVGLLCRSEVGLTYYSKGTVRVPYRLIRSVYLDTKGDPQHPGDCKRAAIAKAINYFARLPLSEMTIKVDTTRQGDGLRSSLPHNSKAVHLRLRGESLDDQRYVRSLIPGWFPYSVDYREVAVVIAHGFQRLNDGGGVCFGRIYLSPRPPIGRQPRFNPLNLERAKYFPPTEPSEIASERGCFKPLMRVLIDSYLGHGEPDHVSAFFKGWDYIGEEASPPPLLDITQAMINEWFIIQGQIRRGERE